MFVGHPDLCLDDNLALAANSGYDYVIVPEASPLGSRLYKTTMPGKCVYAHLKDRRRASIRQQERYRTQSEVRAKSLISGANYRSEICDLDPADIQARIDRGVCEVTGLPFDMATPRGPFSPSLDQIRPGEGYTTNNVQVVCLIFNFNKHNFGDEAMRTYFGQIRSAACLAYR